MMRKIILGTLLILSSCFFFFSGLSLAQEADTTNKDEIEDKMEEIKKYEKKLSELGGRAQSLSNEIEYMDTQVALTQARIQSSINKIQKTEKAISRLAGDISDLVLRIDKLQNSIEYQKKIFLARMRERYKTKDDSVFMVLFGAATLTDLIHKTEYLKIMELNDNKLMADMTKTKNSYDLQKTLFEQKKKEEESLKQQLVLEKVTLDQQNATLQNQKQEKEKLLKLTQNDEAKYTKLLEEAKRELNQITGAVSVLKNQTAKEVKRGEVIGIQGNSGYSFGAHLHFGVYKYSSFSDIDGWNWYYSNYVDPASKLESKTVYWDTGCEGSQNKKVGKGDWDWPMSSPSVSQGFGYTCWSRVYYGGKPHPALDMYGSAGTLIYAVEDGEAYFCRNCLGDGGNGVFIFHDADYMTVYWHLK